MLENPKNLPRAVLLQRIHQEQFKNINSIQVIIQISKRRQKKKLQHKNTKDDENDDEFIPGGCLDVKEVMVIERLEFLKMVDGVLFWKKRKK